MTSRFSTRAIAAAVVSATLAGCATAPAEGELVADPYESLNRDIHSFNVGWDQILVRPATRVYEEATPDLVQFLVSNGLSHLSLPITFIHQTLQLNVDAALETAGRFVTNTFLGAGGLLDPATEIGLPRTRSDAGLTLAEYGVNEGPFVMLPFLGPFTARDAIGRVADFAIDPFNFINIPGGAATSAARAGFGIVDARSDNMEIIDEVFYEAEDSYVTTRTAYIQARRRRVQGDEANPEALPDIFAE